MYCWLFLYMLFFHEIVSKFVLPYSGVVFEIFYAYYLSKDSCEE